MVKCVKRKVFVRHILCLIGSTLLAKCNDKTSRCQRVLFAVIKRPHGVSFRLAIVLFANVKDRYSRHSLCHRVRSVSRLIIAIVSRLILAHSLVYLTQNVITFSALRSCIVPRKHQNGSLGISERLVKEHCIKAIFRHRNKRWRVVRIALKCAAPICIWLDCRIAVLIDVNTRQIKFVRIVHAIGYGHIGYRIGHIVFVKLLFLVLGNNATIRVNYAK